VTITEPTVKVTRRIEAPAQVLFSILADPATHPVLDGSGMLRRAPSPEPIRGVGSVFAMQMHNDEMGEYEMANHVVIFEQDRRIGWEPVLAKAGRPEDEEGVGEPAHHIWAFELRPLGEGATEVTESYDCSRSPEWLRRAVKGGERWRDSIDATLDNLASAAADRLKSAS
jgi:hypothetical protein